MEVAEHGKHWVMHSLLTIPGHIIVAFRCPLAKTLWCNWLIGFVILDFRPNMRNMVGSL